MGIWRRAASSGENSSHGDHGSALLVVMACVAVLFVIGAAVVGAVVFQQAQLSRAAAVSRATQLAQHGMEVYLGAMRRDPQYWNANPRVAGSSTDGTWTATAQPTSSTITAIGHDAASGLLHVIRATVSAKTYSDYTILSNETLNLGSSDTHSDITIGGNVRSNSGVVTASGWVSPGMTIDTSSSARVGSEIGFAKATARFPGLFTAASYRNSWVGGNPEWASSLAFYRDPANPTRNYWGSINNLAAEDTTQSADSEPDRVGVGVDLTNGSDPTTGMFYVRAIWPPAVPGASAANRNMMSRQSLINFAQHDPTWDLGTYGDMQPTDPFTQQPVMQDAFTQAYLNPNGNNVLYVGGDYDVYVKGTYSRSMTIVSERNIYIIGDITRASDATTASLGLVAKNNIYICANMPSTVNAAGIYAADGSGFSGLSYLRGSTSPTARGEVMGQNLTIQAALMAATGSIRMDPASITATSTMKPARRSGTLTIFGSLAANDGLVGTNFANTTDLSNGGFAHTRISYDQQLSVTPPPLFPELGDGQVTVRGWFEYTTMTEPNLGDVALGTTLYPRGSGGGSSGSTWTNSDGTTDTIAPTTISNVRPLYPGPAVITLHASDGIGGSGVYGVYCTIDGGTNYQSLDGGMVWTKLDTATGLQVQVSNPLAFQALAANMTASHSISFWSVDNAGNAEAKHTASFGMVGPDRVPPVTSVWSPWYPSSDHLVPAASAIADNPDYVVWGTFTASFNSADTSGGAGPAEIWVIRDHNPATAISMSGSSGSITLDPPNAGFITHFFEYYAIDKSGNREATKSFTIIQHAADLTAPSTYSDVQASYVGTATINLSAADDPEGMGLKDSWWQLDQGADLGTVHQSMTAATSLPLIKPNADGSTIDSYTLTYYSRDLANNQETPVVKTFTVAPASLTNTSPPTTSSDATSTYIGPATINLGATGPNGVSAVYWRLDTGTQQSGTQIHVPSPLTGSDHHTLYFWATDYAGRVEAEKSASFDVLPDAEHPVTVPYNMSMYSTPTAVFQLVSTANVNEKIAKTYCQIDGQPTHETLVSPAAVIATTTVSVSGEGTHTIAFRAVDVAGNSEATKTTTLRIDTTPPVTNTNAVSDYVGQASIDVTATDTNGSGVKATYWMNEADGYVQTFTPILLGPGTWKVDYWSVDKAGNSEATKTLTCTVASNPSGADTHAPMSYDDIHDYYTSMPAIINLYSWDVESGVQTMFYKLDSASWVGVGGTLSPPFSYIVPVTGEGEHSISYYAKDVTGNIELSHTKFFTIDDVPPTTLSSVSSGRTYWRPQDVTLSALDNINGSGIATTSYRLDGGPEIPGNAVHIPTSDNGASQQHTIEFWSVDKAGNREFPSKSVTFTMRPLDAIPPVTNSDAQTMYKGPAWIHLSPMDNFGGSGIAATFYKVDANLAVQGTLIGVLTGGSHTIEYWSVDNAGNVETHNVRTFSIDTAPPTTTSDALAFYQGDATVKLYASDGEGGSGVAVTFYKVDSGVQLTGTAPTTTVTVSGIGPHDIEYWSIDFIGNAETHHFSHLVIDLTPPTTVSDAQDLYTGTATITLSPTDNPGGSGVANTYYTIDGGSQSTGKFITILPPSSGTKTHTIAFWSVDKVGNVESTNYKNLDVKSAGTYLPVTTSNALAAYTGTATINLTATDVGGPGIKGTYYKLDGGAQTTGTTIVVPPPALDDNAFGRWMMQGSPWSDSSGNQRRLTPEGPVVTAQTSSGLGANASAGTLKLPAGAYFSNQSAGSLEVMVTGGSGSVFGAEASGWWPINSLSVDTNTRTASWTWWNTNVSGNWQSISGTGAANTGPMYVAVTWTSTAVNLYIDGTLVATKSTSNSYTNSSSINLEHISGSGTGTACGSFFTGTILDVRASTVCRTAAQIAANTLVTSRPTHTLQFWSVDLSGSRESTNSASFDINVAPTTVTFDYTGANQYFVVPGGVTTLYSTLNGASGGAGYSYAGGAGGQVVATFPVTPYQTLTVRVGGAGTNYNWGTSPGGWPGGGSGVSYGGGGGGSSSLLATSVVLMEAGGGGGSAYYSTANAGGALGTAVGGNKVGGSSSLSGGGGGMGWNAGAANASSYYGGLGGTSYSSIGTFSYTAGAPANTGNGNITIRFVPTAATGPYGSMFVNNDAPYTNGVSANVNSAVTNGTNTVTQMCVDPGTGTFGTWVAYRAAYPITLPGSDGLKTVRVQYKDAANNTLTLTDSIVLDTIPPVTSSDVAASYPHNTTIHLTPTDIAGSGVAGTYYILDGGPQTAGTSVDVNAPMSNFATHTITYWSTDKAGNTETAITKDFRVNGYVYYTGADQYFTVPANVTTIAVTAGGAQGGSDNYQGGTGAYGGFVTAIIPVTPGSTLTLRVGGAGGDGGSSDDGCTTYGGGGGWPNGGAAAGWLGGGGGGSTTLWYGATELLEAGAGGGGASGDGNPGGYQGSLPGGYQTGSQDTASGGAGGGGWNAGWSNGSTGGGGGTSYIAVGLGTLTPGATGGHGYITINYSAQTRPTGTMTVNNGATCTSSTAATLNSAVSNATQMSIDPGTGAYGSTVAFNSTYAFTLPSGDGTKTVRANYSGIAGGVLPLSTTILLDSKAPTTTSNVAASYTATATIVLSPTDAGSGVAATYYKLDGGVQTTGTLLTVGMPTSTPVTHTVDYWSIDVAGNREATNTKTFNIADVTPPTTTSDVKTSYNGTATVALTATDIGTGVKATYYKVDGGAQTTGTVISVNAPSSGVATHTISYWSVDKATNIETAHPATFTVSVYSVVPPVTTSDVRGSYTGTATITLTPTDVGGPGIKATYYILDGGAQTTGTVITVAPPVTGTAGHTLKYWSVDTGSVREATNSADFTINIAPTWLTFNYTGANQYFTVPAGVTSLYTTLTAAAGGSSAWAYAGGNGGLVTAQFPVTPNQLLTVRVGGMGATYNYSMAAGGWPNGGGGHYYGGGGGGSSSLLATAAVLVEAGGGGGAGYAGYGNSAQAIGGNQGTLPGGNAVGGSGTIYNGGGGGGWNGGPVYPSYYYFGGGGTSYVATGTGVLTPNSNPANGSIQIRFNPTSATGPYGSMNLNNDALYTKTNVVTVNSAVTNGAGTVNLMSVDPGTGTFGPWVTYAIAYPTTLTTTDGVKTVRVQYKDTVGNVLTLSDSILLDRTAPTTSSDATGTYSGNMTINLSAVDTGGSGLQGTYYTIDGGTQQAGTTINLNSPLANTATHTVTYWSTDNAGNIETAISKTFRIDGRVYFTGADQYFVVPTNVNLLHITMYGGVGGTSWYQGYYGGYGGQVTLNLPVTPLSTLTLRVGGAGGDDGSSDDGCNLTTWGGTGGWPNGGSAGGWLGGGGGGSTSVWLGATELAEAGGGGGGGASAGGGGGYQGSNPGGYQWGANDWASGGSGGGGWNGGGANGASGGTGGSSFIAYGFGSILAGANGGNGFMLITYTASTGPYGTMAVNNGAIGTSSTVASVNSTITDDVSTLSQMAIDPGTGVFGAWIAYNASSTITLPTPDGVKTVRALYRDLASNVTTLTDTIILDSTPPTTTSNVAGSYGSTATITFTAVDAGVGVAATYYKLDGGAQTAGTAVTVNPPVSGIATHTVSYWSIDAIGNKEVAHSATFTVNIADATAPNTTSDVQPSYNGTATIHLYPTDAQSGVKATYFKVDGGAQTTGTLITVLAPTSGWTTHTISYWSVDNAGNVEGAHSATFMQTVYDITPPTTTSSFNPAVLAVYPAMQPVSLTATDGVNGSGVRATYYQVDAGAVTTYTTTFNITGDGLHTFTYWSVDYANNTESAHTSNQFRIDTIAPVTTINAVAGSTYIGAQVFTLTATDAGSGVAGTWWQLDSMAGAWTLGTTPTVPAPSSAVAAHTVYFYSKDIAGNRETTKSVAFNVASTTNTITVTQNTGGTITPGTVAVGYNGSQTFTIAANAGYAISNVQVDGVNKGAISSFLFTNVIAPHTITATYVQLYRITVTQTAGGTISPGTTDVVTGGSQAFSITPLAGWGIVNVKVDGVDQGAITSYTFTNVTAAHTITATYAQYLITVTQGANGVISPASTYVGHKLNQSFTITPNAGYSVLAVYVDGVNQGAITSYTFSSVTAAHTITAQYTALSYTITVTQSVNGTITPGTTVVGYGGTQAFSIAPAAGYAISNVVVDGVNKGSVTTYTFSSVIANHTITATYVPYYTILVTQGSYGTITPSTVLVNQGASQSFSITPNAGYTISSVTVDGTNQGAVTGYTFTNVQAGHTLTAAFGDVTPPVTTSNFNPANGGVYKVAQTVTLSATDTGSGVKTTFYKIDGGTTNTYTAPFAISGDGLHTFSYWSVDNANVAETMHTSNQFRIDSIAPVTTSSFNPASNAPFKGNQTVVLTATDTNGSGVAITYYKIDSAAYAQYTGAFTISGDGSHSFSWYSVDNAGNSETPHTSSTFILDTVAPVTTCNAVANQIYNGAQTFTLSVSESGSGVSSTKWQLDGGAWTVGASIPVTAPVTGYYPHTINWYSTDGAGNVETTKSVTFRVSVYDVTPPTTTSDAKAAYNGTSTITLTASDGTGSGVANTYYKMDGNAQVAGTSIVTTAPATGIATHTVEFWSVDMVGNPESPHKSATFTVTVQDTWKPTTTCNAKAFYGSAATFQLEATDNVGGSGVANTFYKIDSGSQQTGTVPTTTVTVSGSGPHTVEYWSVDKAGNAESPHGTATLTIDAIAPTTTSNILSSYNGTATISLTATDNAGGSGVYASYYTVDGGAQTTGTVITVGAPTSGTVTHTVTYWSVDKVNNAEASHHPTTFTIKSLPENMSFTVVPADGSTVVLRSQYIAVTAQDLQGQPIVSATVIFDGASVTTTLTGAGTTLATASFQGVNLADGVHQISATFTVANGGSATKDWSFTEKADRLAPVTDSDIQSIYHGTANIHLTPSDGAGGSGIRATYYRVDGKPQTGGVDITVLAPSRDATSHVIVWWSEDNAGNVEIPHEAVITITAVDDTTPPTTSSDATSVYPVPGLITLTPRDNLGGWGVANTYYKLDSGARYSGTAVRTGGPGTHTLQFWSTDIAGNVEPTVTVAYTVSATDTTPPTTTSTALPSYIGQAQILLHGSDNSNGPVTTYYALDGATSALGSTVTVAPPVAGTATHTLKFWSVDFNGNVESSATLANNVTFTVAAKAVAMTFTNKTPADGTVVFVRNPDVAVTASAAQNLAMATALFDGVSQVPTITWAPGDQTKATVSFSTYGLTTGSHSVDVTFIDVFGNTSETSWAFVVNAGADTIKPTTTMVPVSAMSTGPVLVQLSAVDDPAGTGVAHIYTKVDGGGQLTSNPPTTSLTVSGAGPHSVEYWSVDKANQEEVHQWAFFTIDSLAPTTRWLDQRGTIVGTATITLTPTDNTGGTGVAATYSTVDSGTVQSGTTVFIAPPKIGYKQHTIRWWSVDLAGNIEVQKSYTFNEYAVSDNTPPTTTSSIVPTYAAPSAVTLSADDNPGGSGVTHTYYILDGGIQIESTLLGTGGQGAHTLRFWSVDLAGNIEATNTVAYYVTGADSTPPVTTSNALTSYAGTATVALTATDNSGPGGVAHTYYRIDGGSQTEGTSIVIAPPAWGVPAVTHTIEYWSVDFTGNWENPHPSKSFTVVAVTDVTAPVTGHNANASYIGTATITLAPVDEPGGSGVANTYYRIDDGAITSGTVVTVAPPAAGNVAHSLQIWSVDRAGNPETPQNLTFSVAAGNSTLFGTLSLMTGDSGNLYPGGGAPNNPANPTTSGVNAYFTVAVTYPDAHLVTYTANSFGALTLNGTAVGPLSVPYGAYHIVAYSNNWTGSFASADIVIDATHLTYARTFLLDPGN